MTGECATLDIRSGLIQHTTSYMALRLLTRPGKPVFHSVSLEMTAAFGALLNF